MGFHIFPVHCLAIVFGVLGNFLSFVVYLAPVPTFSRIIKRKSTQGFQCIPYSVALFSAMLLLYYALLKENNHIILITINSVGCIIEGTYLTVFMIYATSQTKVRTTWLLILFNVVLYGLIILFTMLLSGGEQRVTVVGWICASFSLCVFASPLSVMGRVIREKSVEFIPFGLSLSLTLSALVWFLYGLVIKDFYVAVPNVLGFICGIAQMILYMIYKDARKKETKLPLSNMKDLAMEMKPETTQTVNEDKHESEGASAGLHTGQQQQQQPGSETDVQGCV